MGEKIDKKSKEIIPIKTKTGKYNNMITAFQSDFTLAKNDEYKLCNLDDLLECQDERLLEDILLLEELEYGLRHGTLQIMEVEE